MVSELKHDVHIASDYIETFFQHKFLYPLKFYILPDRAELDAHWRQSFNQPWFISICWMVGTGSGVNLSILSPRVWAEENCGHDGNDQYEIYKPIVHELTHSYHGQLNPSDDIGIYENIGWFIEGLAVYVAGQLEGVQLAPPIDAIKMGISPRQLEEAWSGKYRYGVSGSMIKYIDTKWGRSTILKLMQYKTEQDILNELNVSESEFLTGWEKFMLAQEH